jgi:predicted nucleic acid-binding protein
MAAQPSYIDSCVLLSLFLGDSGFVAAETWLLDQGSRPLWISHWVLLEVAGVLALCIRRGDLSSQKAAAIQADFEAFRHERLSLIEPRGVDFLQARQLLLAGPDANEPACVLRSADALHLAMALRNGMELVTADGALARSAQQLGLSCHWIKSTLPFNNA